MSSSSEEDSSSSDSSSISDSEEEEDEEGYAPPDTDFIDLRVADLNPFLTCALCGGYFRDAHSAVECLHTFCKVCILKYFKSGRSDCPVCHTDLGGNPFTSVLKESKLQGIVDKVHPHLPTEDAAKEAFYSSLKRDAAPAPEEQGQQKRSRALRNAEVEVVVKVVPRGDVPAERAVAPLQRPFLRTADRFTVTNLKQYLNMKFPEIPSEEFEIYCEGLPLLAREHTLAFLYKTTWRDRDSEMVLQYCRK